MTEQGDNKRRIDRVRTVLAAKAMLGRGLADIECRVRDLSATGARILIDEMTLLPDRFELRILKTDAVHQVEVKWRQQQSVGVAFMPDRRALDHADPHARLAELEAENARLRKRVSELADRLYMTGETERSEA